MKAGEGGAKIRQREDGARFHLSSVSYFSLLLFMSVRKKRQKEEQLMNM